MTNLRRRLRGFLASILTAVTVVTPATVGARPLPPELQSLSSDVGAEVGRLENQVRDSAWRARADATGFIDEVVNDPFTGPAKQALDAIYESVFPGMISAKHAEQAGIAAEREQAILADNAAQQRARVDTGPCPADAAVCVDQGGKRAWMQDNGVITHGPVPMAPGAPGATTATPNGTFHVNRKVKDEVSYEFNMAPMPYAVYFTYNGHAFHEGNIDYQSAGCVRLKHAGAVHYFHNLDSGDKVFIY